MKLVFKIWFLLYACCVLSLPATQSHASLNNARFEAISLENGLSQQTVKTIFQDSRGYMWFGTQEGLNRYDGLNFKSYLLTYDDDSSISSSWINSISEDSMGNIWVGTNEGLNVLNLKTDKFSLYTNDNNIASINDKRVYKVFRASDGVMWASTQKGLNRFDASTGTFKQHNFLSPNNKDTAVIDISEDITGALWLATVNGGLIRFDTLSEKVSFRASEFFVNGVKTKVSISHIFIDKDHILWISTSHHGIFQLELQNAESYSILRSIVQVESFAEGASNVIHKDSLDSIWVGTSKGLYYKKNGESTFKAFHSTIEGYRQINSSQVLSLYSDASGVLWVGTFNGLHKWNTNTSQFGYFHDKDITGQSLGSNTISTITGDNNGLVYLTSTAGVDVLDPVSREVTSLTLANEEQDGLQDTTVMSMAYVNDEEIWFGYRAHGVSKYNPKTNTYKHYRANREDKNALPGNGISAIIYTKRGELWFGVFGGGLAKYNPKDDSFTTYAHDPTDISSLSSNKILSVYESKSGNLWIGTWSSGLNIFVPSSGTAFRIQRKDNSKTSLGGNKITSVFEDKQGNVWIGTHNGGLNLLTQSNLESGKIEFEIFDSAHGMPSNVVYGITEDENGYLWASTNKGLVKINKNTKEMVVYNKSQGTQGDEYHQGAYYKDENGYMYFGGIGGLTRFHPEDIRPNPVAPKIEFTYFQRLNKLYSLAELLNKDNIIELYYTDYLIGIEFAALDFVEPENNSYRYKLEGFDKDWIEVRGAKRATYTNLPSGMYELKVIAANNDGTWNLAGKSVRLLVHPAPWFSWWAYIVYAFVTSLILWLGYKNYQKKVLAREQYQDQLQKEVQARTAELSEVNKQLRLASITDQLTGLYNRRYLSDVILSRLEDIDRRFAQLLIDDNMDHHKGPRLMSLMFDLDGFKSTNDNYGHESGDKVIVDVAKILKEVCRKDDILIRWGGDEFMIVAEVECLEEAEAFAERIRREIAAHSFDIGIANKFKFSCSIGFALYPFSHYSPHSITWDQVHLLADQALYKSKDAGRNTWSGVVQADLELPFSVLNTLVPNLDKALSLEQVTLVQRQK